MARSARFASLLVLAAGAVATSCVDSETDDVADTGAIDAVGDAVADTADADEDTSDPADTIDAGVDTVADATDDATDAEGSDHDAEPDGSGHEEPHFSYEGETGPEFWGELDEAWATCSVGVEQSPIDFGKVAPHSALSIDAGYDPMPLVVENNGHTIEVAYEGGGELWNELGTFESRQFHFHTPSEHLVNGQSYPLEMHIVHQNEAGQRAVLGVFFEVGEPSASLDAILANAPAEPDTIIEAVDTMIGVTDLLPSSPAGWAYAGSLTTPPCSEAVSWQVLYETVQASQEQIDAMRALIEPNARPVQPLGERHIDGAHFTYEGEEGPEFWGELSPLWTTCGEGVEQSPIDFSSELIVLNGPPIALDYGTSPVTVTNNGHTVQFDYAPGSTMTVDEETWELKQFHFHVASEHTFDGVAAPLELHFVHANEAGELAVLGVPAIVSGVPQDNLDLIIDYLDAATSHPTTIEEATINADDLIPDNLDYYTYDGSLTTPPCTEGVRWFVLRVPMFAAAAHLDAFTAMFEGGTARPTQPLNGRAIE
jgi:carbonic anhydrase